MTKNKRAPNSPQLSIFGHETVFTNALDWPSPMRFPINRPQEVTAGEQIITDLLSSSDPLIITGYSGLDELIDLVGDSPPDNRIRILLGNEPFPGRRHNTPVQQSSSLPSDAKQYWLDRQISILSSRKLLQCIQRLEVGSVEARALPARYFMHAKMYGADEAITVGSSNYSRSGLTRNIETNARFSKTGDKKRFDEAWKIATNYWKSGTDCSDDLIALLNQLLQVVSWQEALSRSCVELLEGEWAKDYLNRPTLSSEESLWPTQRTGIAQAMYILARQGSVLLADATGSGKTRLGVHLVRAVQDRIIRSGRIGRGTALMMCPPNVMPNWEREALHSGCRIGICSHGDLSHVNSARHAITREAVRRAELLCVDEGHNFLDFKSNRTRYILSNMAEHVLLFTATPINRSVTDLLNIVNMLGPDNFEEDTLKGLRALSRRSTASLLMDKQELDRLRSEIQRFTVRRTKRMLNREIDREPGAYTDRAGNRCRFPKHRPQLYSLGESQADRNAARRISELAEQLYAVHYFRGALYMPEAYVRQGMDQETYLTRRCANTPHLLRHQVQHALRSSRAALTEHLLGTEKAKTRHTLYRFSKVQATGNVFEKIAQAREAGPPENRLEVEPPSWLVNPDAHRRACDHDERIYSEILTELQTISDTREQAKAALLVRLVKSQGLVLAFDSHPITLAETAYRLRELLDGTTVLQATGGSKQQRQGVLTHFAPDSRSNDVIGLCSDSLAEGVNLQRAGTLVHLDMPTVVRIAEQRAGRVDRMDSRHPEIDVWWPDDASEFAVRADEQFMQRYEAVEQLIGSNMPLPNTHKSVSRKPKSARNLVDEYLEPEAELWDGVHDAFQPIRDLVGERGLIPKSTYDQYRDVTASVLARVGLVKSRVPWAFFCVRAEPLGAPRWILLPEDRQRALTELSDVCHGLRERLNSSIENHEMDEVADGWLRFFLRQLSTVERRLLSRKKQRALEEMQHLLDRFLTQASSEQDQERVAFYSTLLDYVRSRDLDAQPDWDAVASKWLEICRPAWYEALQEGRRQLLTLKDLRARIARNESALYPQIVRQFETLPLVPPPDERIAACIIGVPANATRAPASAASPQTEA